MEEARCAQAADDRPHDDVVGPDLRASQRERALGDFTIPPGFAKIIALALVIGVISSVVALALLLLIALVTNLAYYQRWSFTPASPADNTLGVLGWLCRCSAASSSG